MFVYKSTLLGSLQETPDFVVDDLYIAGDGLAQGYTDDVQTQKAFIHHPETGLRLYRTGDVAKYLPNGLIEFVGRNDFLVKVGGNRVELQEISTAASSLQGISGIFVDVYPDQLVGFVVPTDETENKVTGMEAFSLLTDEADRKLHKVEHQHDPSLPRSARPSHCDNGSEDVSQALASLLSVLLPVESNGSHKYRYLSAGATYSVNCLVSILNLAGHVSGIYAVDVLGSKLVLLQAHEPEKGGVDVATSIELCFWSDLAKIAPLYGNKSLEFAQLEAGYAIGAMNRELSRSSALHLETCELGIKVEPLLSSMEISLTSARLSLPRGDSTHRDEGKSSLLVSMFQRTNSDQFWLKEASEKRFRASTLSSDEKGVFDAQSIFFHTNAPLLHSASVLITIACKDGALHAAMAAQGLLEEAAAHGIGFTVIPFVSERFNVLFKRRDIALPQVILVGGLLPDADVDKTTVQAILPIHRLNEYLSTRLPTYMLPKKLFIIDQLPLTANGKVDRKSLLAHAEQQMDFSEEGAAVISTEMEKVVAQIWSTVLRLDRGTLTKTSSFAELGGHSLSAIKVQGLLKATLAIPDLPLKVIFANPTLSRLADALEGLGGRIDPSRPSDANARENLREQDNSSKEDIWEKERFDPFPLTSIQQAYFIGRDPLVELGGVATHAYQEFSIPPRLTPELLSEVISALVSHHDALRVIFEQDPVSGLLQQRVLPYEVTGPYQVVSIDVSEEDVEVGQEMVQQVRSELSHQMLDPGVWPLFDVRITKTSWENVLHISLDALIVDLYSSAILAAGTLTLLRAARQTSQVDVTPSLQLAPLKTTFGQLVLSQLEEQTRDSVGIARSRVYWEKRAFDFPNAPELPLSRRPAQVQASIFEREEVIISRSRFAELERLARIHHVMPTTVIAHAFAEALSKYSASPRFIVNLAVFQRPLDVVDADRVVGDFTSSLLLEYDGRPVNADAPGSKGGVRQALRRLNTQLVEDLSHASFSGIDMIRYLRSKGGARQMTFPVVMTSVLNDIGASSDMTELMTMLGEQKHSISQTPQVFLDFQAVRSSSGELVLLWDYLAELFPAGMIRNMHRYFAGVVSDLCNEQGWSADFEAARRFHHHVSDDLDARTALNATSNESLLGQDQLLHTGFLRSALLTPDAMALHYAAEELSLSYVDLARHVHRTCEKMEASWKANKDANKSVTVILPKGWRQVASVFAVLCSGMAYIPIEIDLPIQRITLIMEQASCAKAIISDHETEIKLKLQDHGVDVVVLNDLNLAPSGSKQTLGASDLVKSLSAKNVESSHKAYTIFTSGTTGVPKGVVISHSAAMNTIADVIDKWSLTSHDVTFGISKLNFDLSVFDIFGPLSIGGAFVLPPANCKDPETWASLVVKHKVSIWNSVAMIVQMLIEAPNELIQQAWKSLKLLFISGQGLADGYTDPVKTTGAFINHPFTGERLYKTRDLARYLGNGEIEFIGRSDTQVKIRGHRIELDEIQHYLESVPGVERAAALVESDSIVGALVMTFRGQDVPRAQPCLAQINEILALHLPRYMLVDHVIHLDALPLSANGKVDVKALSKEAQTLLASKLITAHSDRQLQLPSTMTEVALAKIWNEIWRWMETQPLAPHRAFLS
ncbi:hypothetical protein NDA13_005905 [Ustilago tritici]|nr:hypothetical protein NDA13_005905 [Ustilago tritici]